MFEGQLPSAVRASFGFSISIIILISAGLSIVVRGFRAWVSGSFGCWGPIGRTPSGGPDISSLEAVRKMVRFLERSVLGSTSRVWRRFVTSISWTGYSLFIRVTNCSGSGTTWNPFWGIPTRGGAIVAEVRNEESLGIDYYDAIGGDFVV